MTEPLDPCLNNLCNRQTILGTAYCCAACSLAHDGHYEIHESGPLGHSDFCNKKHLERRPIYPGPPPVIEL